MPYEVPKTHKAVIPLYITNRVTEMLKEEWPRLSAQIDDLKPGDELTLTFVFRFKAIQRAYDEEGNVTADFIVIEPGSGDQ